MIDKEKESELLQSPSRRSFLGASSAAFAAATFANNHTRQLQHGHDYKQGRNRHSSGDL
jgi:hypothetical protein